jgi:thioredoxin:protein disulfide reductase
MIEFWEEVLLAYAGGLAVAFTPCVYPLIPVVLGTIGAQRTASHFRAFALSLGFVLGLALTYTILGFLAASGGYALGSLTQRPWVVAVVALVFLAMGISLLGGYSLRLPARVTTWLGARGGAGIHGSMVVGAVSGLLAAPCSAPIAVGILAHVVHQARPLEGLLLLLIYSLGMGTPFLVLGTFSGLLHRIPASGAWTDIVRKLCGVALILAAILYARPLFPCKCPFSGKAPVASTVVWMTDEREALRRAWEEKKPVVIDFGAVWCATCKELDEVTFSDPRVQKELQEHFITVRIMANNIDYSDTANVMRKYDVLTLPTILFLQPTGSVMKDLTVREFVGPEEFLGILEKVRGRIKP